jgi:oligosaccharyl transferase complex subunit OST4
MISDSQLYSLALFLGAAAMLLIVVYHFLEVNAKEEPTPVTEKKEKS